MSALVVVAAGGTGGHIFSAEALAGELIGRGVRVALVTDKRAQAFGNRVSDITRHRIRAGRPGVGITSKLIAICEMAFGMFAARRILRALAPSAAVGFGGYPSVPTMMAASRLRVPTVIHEQNARLGRANRWLAPRMMRIATSFSHVDGLSDIDQARVVETGNPVRPAVLVERSVPYVMPSAGPIQVLVIGGSQGAHILSTVVPSALALLPTHIRTRLVVAQQARPEDLDAVRQVHTEGGICAEVADFFVDAPARMSRAHLVISRAGASTVAELCVIGRPAILVPYRYATDDHQAANAEALAAIGAAWVMSECSFTPDALARRLADLLGQPEQLAVAAVAAQRSARPDAARRLADLVLETAKGQP